MASKLLVVGLGDIRKSDKGLAYHLINQLKLIFAKRSDIRFMHGGIDGSDLYQLLNKIESKKIIIIDTICKMIEPAKFNFLRLKTQGKSFEELLMITIGVLKDDWGKNLSLKIKSEFNELLNKCSNIIKSFLN